MATFPKPELDAQSDVPLYRQLHDSIKEFIRSGHLADGDRLPATRELAGMLGLNRTTVSSAYELLEADGLIRGHVGRGSFVSSGPRTASNARLDWEELLPALETAPPALPQAPDLISFAASRPAEDLFPIDDFRATCDEVFRSAQAASILQLGSPNGYGPLRHHLMEEARQSGVARPGDDIAITNGCQQGLDLLARVLLRPGDTVFVEDPVYPGLKNLFLRAGARLTGVPVGAGGVDVAAMERLMGTHKPKLVVLTPNFQNPTGATIPPGPRREILRLCRNAGAILAENDIYGDLRYEGETIPTLKALDETGDTVLLRSFSKITFPGLRVGWVIGPRPLIARVAEAKQVADLHTDQLSQAVLLRFAVSGRLCEHKRRMLEEGARRLDAVLKACERHLPAAARFTRPEGGMNLWVRLPAPLDAGDLLIKAQRENVAYLPGRYFEISRHEPGALRLSFAGLAPEKIGQGLAVLGGIFQKELDLARARDEYEPAPALV